MRQDEKIKVLQSISSENELRTELVIPLLKKMPDFADVLDNQGSDEAGVDVIGVSTSPFKKPEYTAFVLKRGNITQKAADQKNNLVNVVETQIRTAILHPLTHPRLPSDRIFATRVIVITNGTISRSAEESLRKAFQTRSDINLDFVGCDRLIDKLDELWPRFYEDRRPFLSSYAQKLLASLDTVNLDQLGYSVKTRSLTDIYIDALLFEEDDARANTFPFYDKEPIPGAGLCKQKPRLMVVTSGPGGGKSTLLKEIAISESRDDKTHVAVYLHARDIFESREIRRTAAESLSRLSNDSVEDIYPELTPSKLLLLVDGLDEIASLEDREQVVNKLAAENASTGARVIIGTRPETNPRLLAALAVFKTYSISPLRTSQIRSFFGKWFRGNHDKAARLMEALQDKGVFDKLPRTPMTMTLVAIVYESKEDIPSTLTELYEMFVDLLSGKWDANRQVASAFDSQMRVSFLSRLAWLMQSERLESISQDRCIEFADRFFTEQATIENVDPKEFIQSIIDRSSLVVPTGHDQLRFSHMTFQEYFCAQYLFESSIAHSSILSWFGDDWWREVLFFLAGKRKDITHLVEELLLVDYDDVNTRTSKLLTLGSMLQSGFLTAARQKAAAVQFAAETYFKCYEDFVASLREHAPLKVKRRISRVMLVDVMQELFSTNFSSRYLEKALREAYRALPADREHESARFFIACALSKLGKHDFVLDFATSPNMVDTSMYLISRAALESQNLTTAEKEMYRKFKKRMRDFRAAVRRETSGGFLIGPKKRKGKTAR
jgi:hypothetical protein